MGGRSGLFTVHMVDFFWWSSRLTYSVVSHRLCKARTGVSAKLQPIWWRKLVCGHVGSRFVNGKLLPLRLVAIEYGQNSTEWSDVSS